MSDAYSTQATQVTPDSLAVRRKLAAALLGQAGDTSPVRAWSQGAARLVQGLMGGYALNQTDQDQAGAREQSIKDFSGAFGAQPAAPSPSPEVSPVADMSQPRGYRNNNPLNIEAGSFTQGQPGYSGSDGRFAKFASLDQGTAAASKLLDTYQNKHGLNTPSGIVSRWAPSSDGNNTQSYASSIAKALGIGPNDPVPPEARQQLIAAMAQHENGAALPAAMPQAPQQPAPQQGSINPALIRALSSQFLPPAMGQIAAGQINRQLTPPELKITKDFMGEDIPNTWDANRQLWNGKPLQAGAGGAGGQGAFAGVSPDAPREEVLAAADKKYPGVANRVEQLYRGEGAMPNARQNKLDGPAMQLVQKLHPDWNMAAWKQKSDTMADYSTKGKSGQTMENLAKIVNHMDDLRQSMTEQGNGQYPALNWVGNTYGNIVGSDKTKNVNIGITAVSDEMASLMRREGMSDESIRQWRENISPNASEEQQKGALRKMQGLVMERMQPLASNYERVMGKPIDLWAAFPDSKKAYERTQAWATTPVGGQKAAPQGQPVKVGSPEEARKLPKGTPIILPDGSPGVVP